VVECLPSKCKSLRLNPALQKKNKKKKEFRTKILCCVEETLEVAFQFLGDDKGISN
jgi:hypothetical protein